MSPPHAPSRRVAAFRSAFLVCLLLTSSLWAAVAGDETPNGRATVALKAKKKNPVQRMMSGWAAKRKEGRERRKMARESRGSTRTGAGRKEERVESQEGMWISVVVSLLGTTALAWLLLERLDDHTNNQSKPKEKQLLSSAESVPSLTGAGDGSKEDDVYETQSLLSREERMKAERDKFFLSLELAKSASRSRLGGDEVEEVEAQTPQEDRNEEKPNTKNVSNAVEQSLKKENDSTERKIDSLRKGAENINTVEHTHKIYYGVEGFFEGNTNEQNYAEKNADSLRQEAVNWLRQEAAKLKIAEHGVTRNGLGTTMKKSAFQEKMNKTEEPKEKIVGDANNVKMHYGVEQFFQGKLVSSLSQ